MWNVRVTAPFQYVHEADQIAVNVGMRVFNRVTYAGLGSQVHDTIQRILAKQGLNRRSVGHVDLVERELRMIDNLCQPIAFQLNIVIVVQIVETKDMVTTLKESFGQMKTNEPSGTRNQDICHIDNPQNGENSVNPHGPYRQ